MNVPFERGIHTPEALAGQIEGLYLSDPNTLLVGSLGRAALYHKYLNNTMFEYDLRREQPLRAKGGLARDIDVISDAEGVGGRDPYYADGEVWNSDEARLRREGDQWYLSSQKYHFFEPVHEAVMEPLEGTTVFGIPCLTVRPQTQVAAYGLSGLIRAKDIRTRRALQNSIVSQEENPLPDQYYEPFRQLASLKRPGLFFRARKVYVRHTPDAIRAKLRPVVKTLVGVPQ